MPFIINALDNNTVVRHRAQTRYNELIKLLSDNNLKFTEHNLLKDYGAYGTSVFVHSRQSGKTAGITPVLAVPITTLNDTGEDFHYGFKLALKFIEEISNEAERLPFIVAFLADDWDSVAGSIAFAGFEDLLNSIIEVNNTVILYADITEKTPALSIVHASENSTIPLNVLSSFTDACKKFDVRFNLYTKYNVLYKYKIIKDQKQIQMANEYNIPILYIKASSTTAAGTNIYDNTIDLDNTALAFIDWSLAMDKTADTESTYNYFISGSESYPIFLSEKSIIFFSFTFAILLFLYILFIRYSKKRTKLLFIVMCVFYTLFFIVLMIIDITLVFFALPSLFILSLMFGLHALNKKIKIIKKNKIKIFLIVMSSCLLLSLIPFYDIFSDTIKLIIENYNESNIPYKAIPLETGGVIKDDPLEILVREEKFSERRAMYFNLYNIGIPLRYRIILHTNDYILNNYFDDGGVLPFIYAAPVPYIISAEGIEFILGSYPPSHFNIDITLPLEIGGFFSVETIYSDDIRIIRKLTFD
ncbi:MAG: hypothetical protein LBD07_05145 [Spirochaetaceae bacterium]|jgi:hypothetical protein|nr:hypothetical protein [Spirochaetaceae bacterium]